MRLGTLVLAVMVLPVGAFAQVQSVGDVRVQVLSPTLVRIEQKGPKGFEDRPTFHVMGREFPGAKAVVADGAHATTLTSGRWKIEIPAGAKVITDVRVLSADGSLLYTPEAKLTNSKWLPGPTDHPQVWSIADTPRIVPPSYGMVPAPKDDPLAATSGWDLDNAAPDVYVFLPRGDYRQFRHDFLQLTGSTPLPPLYTFGYWDSRYFVYTQQSALQQIDDYRSREIPLDLLVVDTDWRIGASHGYAPNTKLFPDMAQFLRDAKQKHVRVMFNDHPEPQTKSALDPKELEYRFAGLSGLLKEGLDVWWYDRNWNIGLVEPMPGLRREVWGMKLYHDITASVRPDDRPLIMANVDGIDSGHRNRPPDMAAHRYPIQWTGDTGSGYQFLQWGVENAVANGVQSAFAYTSEDLGGHTSSPTPEGYIRWLEYGTLSPVCRVHCTKGLSRMPWTFGEEANAIVRDYVQMRYRLLPVIYAAARENYETGEPVLRRCDLEWPTYPEAQRNDQYLLGHAILVAPVVNGLVDFRPVPVDWLRTPDGSKGVAARYYSTTQPAGEAVVTRTDAMINFDWGRGSPDPKVPVDNFSAEWTGVLNVPAGQTIRLATLTDDGVRLWVDDLKVIDAWKPQDHITNEAAGTLAGGKSYRIRTQMMELTNDAVAKLLCNAQQEGPMQRKLWLPPGEWVNVWTGETLPGPKEISVETPLRVTPMFVRAGAVIPLAPAMQYTNQKPWDPITLDVYPGDSAQATIYEDDGISNGYEKGEFRKTQVLMKTEGGKTTITIRPAEGTYKGASPQREWVVRLHSGKQVRQASVDGVAVRDVLVIDRKADAMPFVISGGSADGQVIQLPVGSADTTRERVIAVELR